MNCLSCGAKLTRTMQFCGSCGEPVERVAELKSRRRPTRRLIVVISAIVAIAVIAGAAALLILRRSDTKEVNHFVRGLAPDVVRLKSSWDSLAKSSSDPSDDAINAISANADGLASDIDNYAAPERALKTKATLNKVIVEVGLWVSTAQEVNKDEQQANIDQNETFILGDPSGNIASDAADYQQRANLARTTRDERAGSVTSDLNNALSMLQDLCDTCYAKASFSG